MLPFNSRYSILELQNTNSEVPIAIGGVTQRKTSRFEEGVNSQDALGIHIDPKFMAGVVCDGCGTGLDALENSSNEVGAHLLVCATIDAAALLLRSKGKHNSQKTRLDAAFLARLSALLFRTLKSTVMAYCQGDIGRADAFIGNYLTSTILGVILTERFYVAFSFGDGYICVNNELFDLKDQAGQYLSNALLPVFNAKGYPDAKFSTELRCVSRGQLDNLDGVCLATDGVGAILRHDTRFLQRITCSEPSQNQIEHGHDRLLREVRQRVIEGPARETVFSDDATLLLARRMDVIS